MTEGARRGDEKPPVKWLTAAEVDSWLSVVRLMTWLPWSIDQQLQRDSNLGMVEYQVLAMLSGHLRSCLVILHVCLRPWTGGPTRS